MNHTGIRIIHWILDSLLAVWIFLPIQTKVPQAKPICRIKALICLLLTFPIYVFVGQAPFSSYILRLFCRILAYLLYLLLGKGLSWRQSLYFALLTWLCFNVCYNVLLSPPLQSWFLIAHISEVPGAVLVHLLYIVVLTLLREVISFEHIREPGGLRICFASLLVMLQIFIKLLSDRLFARTTEFVEVQLYILLIQVLLGASLALFERYQYNSEQAMKERVTAIASEYRYQATLSQKIATDDVSRLHHDMKNHLLAIRQLSKDNNRLSDYINTLMDELSGYECRVETGNTLLDGLIERKLRIADQNGIDLVVQLDFRPCNSIIEDIDVCVIFGNLLDNAIEASKKLTDPEQRSILLKSHLSAEKLVITISNFYDGVLQISNGLPQTTKADQMHHGIGLTSVRQSVEKYGGILIFRTAPEQRLIVAVLLPTADG